jgi:hypothetical protein
MAAASGPTSAVLDELRFCVSKSLRDSFRDGTLGRAWAAEYPELFDKDDVRLLRTQHQRNYNFFEWLGAVLLYKATGYRSLVAKYGCKSHPHKLDILRRVCSKEMYRFLCEDDQNGAPDLFVYDSATHDFFFCEVKGPGDVVKPSQMAYFGRLHAMTGRPVRILWLAWA